MTVPTMVYRLFNAEGRLLYVGVSRQPWYRFTQHANHKPWWPLVAAVQMENFTSRGAALAAEAAAIAAEEPAHNGTSRSRAHIRTRYIDWRRPTCNTTLERVVYNRRKLHEWTMTHEATIEAAFRFGHTVDEIAARATMTVEEVRDLLLARGVELRSRGGRH